MCITFSLKAERWLREQAQALGWSKATKLEGRQTTQGLVGVAFSKQIAAMVEVNCETDFVARNGTFQETVHDVAETCLKFAKTQPNAAGPLTTVCILCFASFIYLLFGKKNVNATVTLFNSLLANVTLCSPLKI